MEPDQEPDAQGRGVNAPCLETFGVTPPACLCLLPHGHAGPHVCAADGAAWLNPGEPGGISWPGPGGPAARQERLTNYARKSPA